MVEIAFRLRSSGSPSFTRLIRHRFRHPGYSRSLTIAVERMGNSPHSLSPCVKAILEEPVSLKSVILGTSPTSYWPLDDAIGSAAMHDECGRHDGQPVGVKLAATPFGATRMPHFDGQLGSVITIPDDDRYSHTFANALSVACWVAPSVLDFPHTQGSKDQFIHFIEKAVKSSHDVEWAFRLYNATNPERSSRLSFYLFNSGHPTGKGAGAYMQYGESRNDRTPVKVGEWLFLVGLGEGWIDGTEQCRGALFYKQGALAARSPTGDKYNNPPEWNVRPHNGPGVITLGGSIGKTAFCGAMGHVSIWNRLLNEAEVASMLAAGQAELELA